ncbi:outer membrane beta-barrel protein [uncultured Coprobacter sp.]|uniref:outer membrane beta-barrel protein n=1 Tax=uncultured Coprobacter sp. TaxID=1720550 RepID=UPI0026228981|nr:outer membrane beta-barrel protein [uncultured Coprobacter sp.]
MKKLLLATAVCLLASANSFAQYKPEAGTVTTEIQFNPFNQDNENFSIDGLKLRYFFNEKHALRLNLGFGVNSNKFSNEGVLDDADKTSWSKDIKSKQGNFNLGVGYEYHIDIAPRLSVYVGGETGFLLENAKTTFNTKTGNVETDLTFKNLYTDASTFDPDLNNNPLAGCTPSGKFSFYLKALTGFDFYMYKGLYCGTEFWLGLQTSNYKKLGLEGKIDGTDIDKDEYKNDSKKTDLELLFNVVPSIRLGWRF